MLVLMVSLTIQSDRTLTCCCSLFVCLAGFEDGGAFEGVGAAGI
jgi:hypothetical protein